MAGLKIQEVGRRLVLMLLHWREIQEARREDREKRVGIARAYGVTVDSYFTYLETRRPPGVKPPYHDRPLKSRKGKPKKRKQVEAYEEWEE